MKLSNKQVKILGGILFFGPVGFIIGAMIYTVPHITGALFLALIVGAIAQLGLVLMGVFDERN